MADLYGIQDSKSYNAAAHTPNKSATDLPDGLPPPPVPIEDVSNSDIEDEFDNSQRSEAGFKEPKEAPGARYHDLSEINALGDISIAVPKKLLEPTLAEKVFEGAEYLKDVFAENIHESIDELKSATLAVLNDLDRRIAEYPDALPDAYKQHLKDLVEKILGSLSNVGLFFEAIKPGQNVFQEQEVVSGTTYDTSGIYDYIWDHERLISIDEKVDCFIRKIWGTTLANGKGMDISHLFFMLAGSLPAEVPDFKMTEKSDECIDNLKKSIHKFAKSMGGRIPLDYLIPYKNDMWDVTQKKSEDALDVMLIPDCNPQQDPNEAGKCDTLDQRLMNYYYKRLEMYKRKIGNRACF